MANRLNHSKYKKAGKAYGSGNVAGTDTTWTLKGKYLFQSIRTLPVHYLCWISENYEENNKHKIKADRELQRRYYRQQTGLKNDPSMTKANTAK